MEFAQFPPRFEISGVVLNVFETPTGTDRAGKAYGGDWTVQLMSVDHLRNGESKCVPTDLRVGTDKAEAEKYKSLLGKVVKVPCSVNVNFESKKVYIELAKSVGKAVANAR